MQLAGLVAVDDLRVKTVGGEGFCEVAPDAAARHVDLDFFSHGDLPYTVLSGRYASVRRSRSPGDLRHNVVMAGEWWSGIELRHLVALDAVAREGSFRRAATHLGYVQSAISHQIAALENLTGKRLIERSRGTRPLALTEAGEILLSHADAVIARVRAAQADLAALDGNGAAALRVGATPDLLARLVPSFLRVYGAPVSLHETAGHTHVARRARAR